MGIDVWTEKPLRLVSRIKKELKRIFPFPSRFFRIVDGFGGASSLNIHGFDTAGGARPTDLASFTPLPGPWGFLTSGYIVGLVIMAILLHRIQNIVVPPRHHFPNHASLQRSRVLSHFFPLFPLDLSSSSVRLALRLPTLYFLAKSLLLWIFTLAQTTKQFPPWASPSLLSLANWVARQEMATLCWSTFCSVCGTLCVEALTRGLEGANSNGSPFNLFGYAFLLHIYSSPMTHSNKLEGLPSRPDKHIVVTIMLPLLHLTIVHCAGINQKWSNHRLIPSAIISLIGLIHFHAVLWFSKSSYPLLNYMPCLFESLLLSFVILAVFLNALTQLVTEGSITRPLFGHHSVLLPKWDEDFSIALLRMGTASLETSSVAGFGNEVGSVSALTPSMVDESKPGTVELSRFGVASVSRTFEGRGKNRRAKKGLANEIKCVKAASAESELWLDMTWYREFTRFTVGVTRRVKSLFQLVWGIVRGRSGLRARSSRPLLPTGDEDNADILSPLSEGREPEEVQNVYARFVSGEDVSDDDHDEFAPGENSSPSCSRSSSVAGDSAGEEDESQQETVDLYADLSAAMSASMSSSLLLAHMVDNSTWPLTRRRFNDMLSSRTVTTSSSQGSSDNGWTEVVRARRPLTTSSSDSTAAESLDSGAEPRHNCVICTVEPRQIICWPCRCFALCDDCRENLASRSSASKHICPCCRRNVEGYSKIYIP